MRISKHGGEEAQSVLQVCLCILLYTPRFVWDPKDLCE